MASFKVNAPEETSQNATNQVETRVAEYLEASLGVVPNLEVQAKHIYYIQGVGSVFNGNYYVRKMKYSLSNNGLKMTAELVKVEKVNYYRTEDVYDNRPDRKPAPPAPPKGEKGTGSGNDYKTINRMGRVTAGAGLHARQGTPFGIKVNSAGFAISDVSKAPSIGVMRKGTRVKVLGEREGWYHTNYGGSSWSYKRFIQLE